MLKKLQKYRSRISDWANPVSVKCGSPQEAVSITPRGQLVYNFRIIIRRMMEHEFAEHQLHRIISQEFQNHNKASS